MRRRRMRITDLNFDVLKHIMFLVATSSDGAINLARVKCVCKEFRKLSEEVDILEAVNFNDVKLPVVGGSFWMGNSLLNSSACAGNLTIIFNLIKNLIDRIKSTTAHIAAFQVAEMYIRMEARGRYCTRARMRAVKPFLEVIFYVFTFLEVAFSEIVEIIKMLESVKSSLSKKQAEALPVWLLECYKKVIEFIDKLSDMTSSISDLIAKVMDMVVFGSIHDPTLPLANHFR